MRIPALRGVTLAELLVTIAILSLVMALLGFPLLSAFSYIQKAVARNEALRASNRALPKLERELSVASYVYSLPPDGSWVSFLQEPTDSTARSLGMVMDAGLGNATLIRYAQIPDFPWQANGGAWQVLHPNYEAESAFITSTGLTPPIYSAGYVPYHNTDLRSAEPNPYILARMEQTLSWNDAWTARATTALDGAYPMNGYTGEREELWRRFRNTMIAVTPYGAEWDTPSFHVTPVRIPTESLTPLVDAQGRTNPTVVLSRYPLWDGHNRDLDDLTDVQIPAWFSGLTDADIDDELRAHFPLSPRGLNPFGYQVRVYDNTGALLYGTSDYSSSAQSFQTLVHMRHFMEWPPIDRLDWAFWGAETPWQPADIARQRDEGKVVFAQPMQPSIVYPLWVTDYSVGSTIVLPIPTGWDTAATTLVTPPRRIIFTPQAGGDKAFKLVQKDATALGAGEFCVVNAATREIALGAPLAGPWTVTDANARACRYTICDLQPTDVVVASYTTRAVLDVALTVSRQDHATKDPAKSRQDYPMSMRIEARNAMKRARGNQ